MAYRGLQIAEGILFRTFGLGFLFLILSWLWWLLLRGPGYSLVLMLWPLHDAHLLDLVALGFFALAKFVLFFYVLIPAIAIRLTRRSLEKHDLTGS